jgi:hypothetical protein
LRFTKEKYPRFLQYLMSRFIDLNLDFIENEEPYQFAGEVDFEKNVIFSNGDEKVEFHGPVVFHNNDIEGINATEKIECDACEENNEGFEFSENNRICLNCIRDMAIQFRAKESWVEKHGDPIKKLMDRIYKLEKELEAFKKS